MKTTERAYADFVKNERFKQTIDLLDEQVVPKLRLWSESALKLMLCVGHIQSFYADPKYHISVYGLFSGSEGGS